jgi:hypothetical protein
MHGRTHAQARQIALLFGLANSKRMRRCHATHLGMATQVGNGSMLLKKSLVMIGES